MLQLAVGCATTPSAGPNSVIETVNITQTSTWTVVEPTPGGPPFAGPMLPVGETALEGGVAGTWVDSDPNAQVGNAPALLQAEASVRWQVASTFEISVFGLAASPKLAEPIAPRDVFVASTAWRLGTGLRFGERLPSGVGMRMGGWVAAGQDGLYREVREVLDYEEVDNSTGSTSTTTQEEVFYETSRPLVPWGLVSAGVDYQPFRGPTIGVGAAVQNVPVYVGNTTATRHCVAIDGEQTCDGTLEIEPSEMAVVVSPWLDLGWFAGEHTSLNAQLWWHAYGPESLTRSVPLGARAALGFRW
ncbi:MAG TPA: hypothetical protein QGF58_23010 [Myxococcota bacterium]|nr:hypothetical protein [Myxococcota bacterium]